ncbi:MAG TPA: O-antigen ligase family protein, partial [Chloroflexota bacterium]|nr:O-antigen ligase family protein [Chloroflexota bacterium]
YVSRVPATMLACQQLTVPVTVENHSPFLWQSQGPDLYNLGYHWLYASGKVAIFENPRSRLQGTVPPGAAQTVPAHIQAPPRAGRYLLVWDMVQENVTWFSLKRAAYVGLPVLVRQGPSPRGAVCAGHARRAVAHGDGPAELPRSFSQPGRTQLWAAALRMLATHPLLGVGPDGYRFRYGAYMRPPLATWDTRILANQLFLELFADLGLLGGGLFLAFLCAVWWPLVVALWTRRRSTVILWQITLLAALAAFLGHGLVDYLLESHAIFLLLWLICGLASATYLRPTLPGPRRTGLDPSSQVAGPAPRENTAGRGSTQPARTEGAQCL